MRGPSLPDTSDFDRYMGTPDAQGASPWELNNLAVLRRAIGRQLTVDAYARMREQLASKIAKFDT